MHWNCDECKKKPHIRAVRGCLEPTKQPIYPFDFRLRRCPHLVITNTTSRIVNDYKDFNEFKIFPFGSKTIDDEPFFVIEAFSLIREIIAEHNNRIGKEKCQRIQKKSEY